MGTGFCPRGALFFVVLRGAGTHIGLKEKIRKKVWCT